jgi:hypothetical protein
MSAQLKLPPGKLLYNLTGVLIHIGGNAHRGHYKAQIKVKHILDLKRILNSIKQVTEKSLFYRI